MSKDKAIIRCASCDGFGWFDDEEFSDESEDCDWCGGVGYVYRHGGRDHVIPRADYAAVADKLEALELERLREMGYQGNARKPWQQAIRKDTELGENPYSAGSEE